MNYNNQIIALREELLIKIKTAVERNGGSIDLFDCDEDVEDIEDIMERIDTPLIVANTSDHQCFGGFAVGHVVAVFIEPRSARLYVTIKRENGDDYDAILSTIQIEGLILIVSFLEGKAFIEVKTEDPWRCDECGSLNVEKKISVDANSGQPAAGDDFEDYLCIDCENKSVIRTSDLINGIDDWWKYLEGATRGDISGVEYENFHKGDSDEELLEADRLFTSACDDFWGSKTTEEKIEIWRKLSNETNA